MIVKKAKALILAAGVTGLATSGGLAPMAHGAGAQVDRIGELLVKIKEPAAGSQATEAGKIRAQVRKRTNRPSA